MTKRGNCPFSYNARYEGGGITCGDHCAWYDEEAKYCKCAFINGLFVIWRVLKEAKYGGGCD